MRTLERLGVDRHVVDLPEGAVEVDALLCPCLEQDVHALLQAFAALLLRHGVTVKLHRAIPAAEANDQPPAAQNVERRGFFGQTQRVMKGNDVHGGAEADALGARGNGGHERGRSGGQAVVSGSGAR